MKNLTRAAAVFCALALFGGTLAAQTLPKVKLIPVLKKMQLDHPDWMTEVPDGSGRFVVVEQIGIIYIVPKDSDGSNPAEFLNIENRKPFVAYEMGLFSLAFHPGFKTNGLCYISYSRTNADPCPFPNRTVISELKVSSTDSNKLDLSTERILFELQQPFLNHKAGLLAFGPDGYLYISVGDGGLGLPPSNNAQNSATLLGKILRIDVNSRDSFQRGKTTIHLPYGIPSDNPFVQEPDLDGFGARHEIYAWGLRNPWRFSFDRQTGQLWAGDVGQDLWEEIDLIVKGGNYGWDVREGAHHFKPGPAGAQYIDPVIEYPHKPQLLSESQFPKHGVGMCVIGGYVYRGKKYPALQGVYVYADYALGTIFGLRYEDGKVTTYGTLLEQPKNIDSFAEDLDGELYAIALDGHVYSIATVE